jgi:hypothetical protein
MKKQSWFSRLLFGRKKAPRSLVGALLTTQSEARGTMPPTEPAQGQGQTNMTGEDNRVKTSGDLRHAREIALFFGHDPEKMRIKYAQMAYICAPSAADLRAVIGDRPSATLRGDHTCKWIIGFFFFIPGKLGVRSTETQMKTFAQSFEDVFSNHREGRFRSLDSTFVMDVATSEIGLLITSTGKAETACMCCESLEYAFRKLSGAPAREVMPPEPSHHEQGLVPDDNRPLTSPTDGHIRQPESMSFEALNSETKTWHTVSPLGLIICLEPGPAVRERSLENLAKAVVSRLPDFTGFPVDDFRPVTVICAQESGFTKAIEEQLKQRKASVYIFGGCVFTTDDGHGRPSNVEFKAHAALITSVHPGSRGVMANIGAAPSLSQLHEAVKRMLRVAPCKVHDSFADINSAREIQDALRKSQESFADVIRARATGDISAAMRALEETLDLDPAHLEANQYLGMLYCLKCAKHVKWQGLSSFEKKKFWAGQCPKCESPMNFDRVVFQDQQEEVAIGTTNVDKVASGEQDASVEERLNQLVQQASQVADKEFTVNYVGGGVLLQCGECSAFLEAVDKALELAPNDPDLLFAKSEALEARMEGATAQEVRRRALTIAPNHFDCKMREQHYQEWENLFTNPAWSESMKEVPSVMLGWQRDGVPVQIVHDRLKPTFAILRAASRSRFPNSVRESRWKPVWVDTPFGPLFAHYVMLDLGGGRISRDEALLSPYPVTPIHARNGDWLVRRFCNIRSIFLVYNDGGHVLYNKRFIFPEAICDTLQSIANKVNQIAFTPDHIERFQKAANYYMQHSNTDDIAF